MDARARTSGLKSAEFDYAARWVAAASLMEAHGVDAVFVMKPANLAYLTGDGRPCALALLTRERRCIVAVPASDVRSVREISAATEVRSFRSEEEMFHGFRDVLAEERLSEGTIAVEKNFFDAALYGVFTTHLLPKAKVVSATPILSRLRMLKEPEEIECLKGAGRVADEGMAAALDAVRAGVRETDVAGEAEYAMRRAGAEGWASITYVASGWRSGMAHGPASRKVIADGEVVQVHVAPIWCGYTVDLCRTTVAGEPSEDVLKAFGAYRAAQEAGIAAALTGAALSAIDTAMASSLQQSGFGEAFLRPVFHGVGIEHEEAPIPGGHAVVHGEEKVDRIEAGMVLAIGNCGIYREDFGARMEDTVWVSERGPVPLTHAPKVLVREGAQPADSQA